MADSSESFRQPPDLEVLRRLAAHWDTKTSTFVDMSAIWDSTAAMADDPPAWIFDTCALPNVAPPLQSILAFGRGVFALDAYEVTDPEFGAFMKGIGVMATPGFGSSYGESQSWKWPNFPASTKWVYCITQVIAMPDGPRALSVQVLPVDGDGRSLGLSGALVFPDEEVMVMDAHGLHLDIKIVTRMTLFGISLMHCRNVSVVDTEEKVSRQVRRARERKGKLPALQYKVLRIKPTGGSGESGETTDVTPMHICRGHFKTYTEEAPLFGRITGTYWWSDQVRGRAKNGVVVKDYKVG